MNRLLVVAACALLVSACREPDGPAGPGLGGGRMWVTSEPQGARIYVDGRDTGLLTPDTVRGLRGIHDMTVRLDSGGYHYEYHARISIDRDTTLDVHGPLTLQCVFTTDLAPCYRSMHQYRIGGGIRFATNPLGSLFLYDGQSQGLFWPATTQNSYIAGAIPVFAGRVGNGSIALGIYDHGYLAGRPAPASTVNGSLATLRQSTWILPPTALLQSTLTVRGIEIRQEITTSSQLDGVILVRLVFRNITGERDYRLVDPFVPPGGFTYRDAFIGLALDPDIGVATDDWFSYDPELDMTFAYDARFAESSFTGGAAMAPSLVGLRMLRAPEGTSVVLNGWTNQAGGLSDWMAGTGTEGFGLGMLSGTNPYQPAHSDPKIGHLPTAEGDMRISVSAGPLNLEPDDEAEIVLAVILAPPAANTYQSGSPVMPGDPFDTNRALYRIAAILRDRARAAESLLD